jgi:hypothetical protein
MIASVVISRNTVAELAFTCRASPAISTALSASTASGLVPMTILG